MIENKKNEINDKQPSLFPELLLGLPEKTPLGSEIDIVMAIKNVAGLDLKGIIINPGNLLIKNLSEERETKKAIETFRSFTLLEYGLKPRILEAGYWLQINAIFKATELGEQFLTMTVEYIRANYLSNETEKSILNIQDLKDAKTKIVPSYKILD